MHRAATCQDVARLPGVHRNTLAAGWATSALDTIANSLRMTVGSAYPGIRLQMPTKALRANGIENAFKLIELSMIMEVYEAAAPPRKEGQHHRHSPDQYLPYDLE